MKWSKHACWAAYLFSFLCKSCHNEKWCGSSCFACHFYWFVLRLTLESCDEQVIRFQCFWNQCLCGHLLPYGMYLVFDMLYVFWTCCYVFSCGLLHCLALEVIESLLEQANFYMKEIPFSDLNFSIGASGLLWCELQLMLDDSVLQGWNCEIGYYSLIYELGSEMNWPNC